MNVCACIVHYPWFSLVLFLFYKFLMVMTSRSVYLHNNKLTDAGLPDHMFNDSDNLEIITMSSNFLRVVPNNLPSSLYRFHLKVLQPFI